MTNLAHPSQRVLSFVDERPDRFSIGIGGHNLLRPMENLRALEGFVADHQVAYTVVGPASGVTGCIRPATRCTTRSTRSAASSNCPCA
jgi:hypothetical protein